MTALAVCVCLLTTACSCSPEFKHRARTGCSLTWARELLWAAAHRAILRQLSLSRKQPTDLWDIDPTLQSRAILASVLSCLVLLISNRSLTCICMICLLPTAFLMIFHIVTCTAACCLQHDFESVDELHFHSCMLAAAPALMQPWLLRYQASDASLPVSLETSDTLQHWRWSGNCQECEGTNPAGQHKSLPTSLSAPLHQRKAYKVPWEETARNSRPDHWSSWSLPRG